MFFHTAYWRRCHLTVDRIGMLVAGKLGPAEQALCIMTVGARSAPGTNIDEVVEQRTKLFENFWSWVQLGLSRYPYMVDRIVRLRRFAVQIGMNPMPNVGTIPLHHNSLNSLRQARSLLWRVTIRGFRMAQILSKTAAPKGKRRIAAKNGAGITPVLCSEKFRRGTEGDVGILGEYVIGVQQVGQIGKNQIYSPIMPVMGRQKRVSCYAFAMSHETQALLDAFEHLPAGEKRAFTEEVLRRSLPFDSGPLADEEIGAASDALGQSLDEEGGDAPAR